MARVVYFSELAKHFSWRLFAALCALLSCFFAYKLVSFEPEYRCTLFVQPPQHHEIMGVYAGWELRERVAAIASQKVSMEARGALIAFSARGDTQDAACAQLGRVRDYLGTVNSRVSASLALLKNERAQLEIFFATVLLDSDRLEKQFSYVSFLDRSLSDLLRRKIFLDRVVADPALLEFSIHRDVEPDPQPRLHFVTRHTVMIFGVSLLIIALTALLVAYFQVLLKSEHDR
jgi:hypothetical protein